MSIVIVKPRPGLGYLDKVTTRAMPTGSLHMPSLQPLRSGAVSPIAAGTLHKDKFSPNEQTKTPPAGNAKLHQKAIDWAKANPLYLMLILLAIAGGTYGLARLLGNKPQARTASKRKKPTQSGLRGSPVLRSLQGGVDLV